MFPIFLCVSLVAIVQAAGSDTYSGDKCTFPFVYRGVTYTKCTKVDDTKLWCATGTKEYKLGSGNWAYCCSSMSDCKLDCRELGGYVKDKHCDTCKCAKANPCEKKPCGSAKCNVKDGKAVCSCPERYTLSGKTCVFVPKCAEHYTPWNANGGGNGVYLDRHNLVCPKGSAMTSFHLENKSKSIRYRYRCCTVENDCSYQAKPTGYNADGRGNIVYLDRQAPNCGSRGFITDFHLQRSKDMKQYRYQTQCCEVKSQTDCYTASTAFQSDGGGKLQYLDRQSVYCKNNYYLSYFHLNRSKDHKHIRYTFKCCRVGNPCEGKPCGSGICTVKGSSAVCSCKANYRYNSAKKSCDEIPKCNFHYTRWNSLGGGNAVYLDRQNLVCPKGSVMSYFHMETSGKNIRYRFRCCRIDTSCSYKSRPTGYNADGGGNIVYLDRQAPNCGTNGFITQFHLQRSKDLKHYRYETNCCDVKSKKSCYTANTAFQADGGGKLQYLDRQAVNCKENYFLDYFHLNRSKDHKHVRYTFRCCELA